MVRECKSYDSKFKAKIALEILQGKKELIEIAAEYNVPKSTIVEWRDKLLKEAELLFVSPHEKEKQVKKLQSNINELHKVIGEITIENSFLKKKLIR
jgi:transposase-like protein